MEHVSDTELLTLVAAGSSDALETLYHRHVVRLSRRCADPAIVHEVLQNTFVAVWRGAKGFSGKGEPAAWLWGIAIRRLVDAFRKRPPAMALIGEADLPVVESAEDAVGSAARTGVTSHVLEGPAPTRAMYAAMLKSPW